MGDSQGMPIERARPLAPGRSGSGAEPGREAPEAHHSAELLSEGCLAADQCAADVLSQPAIRIETETHMAMARTQRLDRYLAARLAQQEISRTRIQRWIAIGAVRVDGALALPSRRLRGVEVIDVWPQPLESERAFRPEPVAVDVLYSDQDLAVIVKPAGLVVHPAPGHWQGTLLNGLLHRFPAAAALPRAGIVHRLDRDTSGLMVCALSERGFTRLVRQLADRSMGRTYLAVIPSPPSAEGTIEAAIGRDPRSRQRMAVLPSTHPGARAALTRWRVRSERAGFALVECSLHTGRTHQIRVHFASIGRPLVGDLVYGGSQRIDVRGIDADGASALAFPRQALHAWQLRFKHPQNDHPRRFRAVAPPDFIALVNRLGLDGACACERSGEL